MAGQLVLGITASLLQDTVGPFLLAVWLGILTSIHPCPLTTNLAALSFVTQEAPSIRRVLRRGLVYAVGRAVAYAAVTFLIVQGLLAIGMIAAFLNAYVSRLTGLLLIVAGMFLLNLIRLRPRRWQVKGTRRHGLWEAFALGVLLAMDLCPISAAIFFGSLVPLALAHGGGLLLAVGYGVGTGLPVVAIAAIFAAGAGLARKALTGIQSFERTARVGTGVVFILAGIYLTLLYVFGLSVD